MAITLETARLLLRPPAIADAEPVFRAWGADPLAVKYLTWLPHRTALDSERFLTQAVEDCHEESWIVWMIEKKGGGPLIGSIDLRIDGHKAEFGYVLGRAFWGQGFAVEALTGVVEYAFSRPEIHRVWAVCDIENTASARVMEKAGLVREGILKRFSPHPNVSDIPADVFVYAKVR